MKTEHNEQQVRQQLREHLSNLELKSPSAKTDEAILQLIQNQAADNIATEKQIVSNNRGWAWSAVAALVLVSFLGFFQFSGESVLNPLEQLVIQSQQLETEIAQVEETIENPLVWIEAKKIKSQIIELDHELFTNYQSNGSADKRINLWSLRVEKLVLLKTIYQNDNQLYRI